MIRISFFGGLKAMLGGQPSQIRGVNERALLAYFCVEGDREYTRDYLATLLWPDSDAKKARQNLRAALFHLRQALQIKKGSAAEPLLVARREGLHPHLRNHPDLFWSDVGQFIALNAAIKAHPHARLQDCLTCRPAMKMAADLYQGAFFHDAGSINSHVFEDWLTITQESLRLQVIVFLSNLAQAYAEEAQLPEAIHSARQLVELNPYQAVGQRLLLQALAKDGQFQAAQEQYERYRQTLEDDFGTAPDAEIQNLLQRMQARSRPVEKPANPYFGLAPFAEQDAALFFGREEFLATLHTRLLERNFVVVIGDSGSGKSSVVFAGLLPKLRSEPETQWGMLTMRPEENPVEALVDAFVQAGYLAPCEQLDLENWLCDLLQEDPAVRVLLVVDQFEEIFNPAIPTDVQDQFIAMLLKAQDCENPLHVVLTMRADFLPQAIQNRSLADALQAGALLLGPMNRAEMQRAILRPAAQRNVAFAPGLVGRLLDAVHAEPGSLVLLQFTLTRLWEAMPGQRMTHEDYEAIGGLEHALAQYAEEVFARFSAAEQEQTKRVFLKLIHSQANIPDTRRLVAQADFPPVEWQIVQRLADFRLLTTREDRQNQPIAEIVHEALITHWERLQTWLNENRAFRLWRARLQFAYRLWADHLRDPEALLGGPALLEAEKWLLTHHDLLNAAEEAFISQSLSQRDRVLQAQETEQQRRLEQAEALALAERQNAELQAHNAQRLRRLVKRAVRQRQIARRQAKVTYSLSQATRAQLALHEGDPEFALALAYEAAQIPEPPPQVHRILAEAAYAPGTRQIYQGHRGPITDFAVAPDGWQTALSASADGTLILWNLQSSEIIREFRGHRAAVHGIALLPGGHLALSASADGTLLVWDMPSGEIVRGLQGHRGTVRAVTACPGSSGLQALSASDDGTLILWDVETGEIIRRFEGHSGPVYTVAVSPDGQTALSGSADQHIILWDLNNGQIIRRLHGMKENITPTTADLEVSLSGRHQGPISKVIFGPHGRTAYSVAADRQLIYWELETGSALRADSFNAGILSIGLSPDGRTLLLGRVDGLLMLWSPFYGQVILKLPGHAGRIQAATFSPDGRQALTGATDGSLRLWDLRSGAEIRSLTCSSSALDIDISPDGNQLLLAMTPGEIILCDPELREIRRLIGHTETPFAGVRFRPRRAADQPRTAISGAGDVFGEAQDNTLRLWNVKTGDEIWCADAHTDRLWDLDLSPDGRTAASASHDGTVRLWNLDRGTSRVIVDLAPQAARSVAISPDRQKILAGPGVGASSAPNFSLQCLEQKTGALLCELSGHTDAVCDIVFSPDGQTALSAAQDKLLILWDLENGEEMTRFVGHTAAVYKVCFSPALDNYPAGRFALSAGLDDLIIFWDIEAGVALRNYRGHVGGVLGLVFAPDGNSFYSAALDDTVRQWRLDSDLDELLAWVNENRSVPDLPTESEMWLGAPQNNLFVDEPIPAE